VRNDYWNVNFSPSSSRLRGAVTTASSVGFVLIGAGPAAAHIEVSAESAQAGTGPVTLSFMAESESPSAGIVSVKTQLPDGIAPATVSLAGAPEGWVLTPTADGFELGGPALAPGLDAEYSVAVTQLPADATELAFPTLQRYSDGREDAWIEPVTDALPDPEKPAPVLSVAPAPPGATTAATPSPTATDAATSEPTASTDAQTDEASQSTDDGSNTGMIALVAGALALLAIGASGWAWRARHRA
jgi:Domain of unkown function (DUF1775)